jgi:hypothetical protein
LVEGSTFSRHHLKERLFAESLKRRECETCGQGEIWRGGRMALILDHINGIPDDHRLENLRILWPNCAATLRPSRRLVERPPLHVLLAEVARDGYLATGRKYGVSDNAIRKWVRFYENEMARRRREGADELDQAA